MENTEENGIRKESQLKSQGRTKKMDISDKCLESDLQFGYTVVISKTFCHLERHLNDNFVGCREVLVSG